MVPIVGCICGVDEGGREVDELGGVEFSTETGDEANVIIMGFYRR